MLCFLHDTLLIASGAKCGPQPVCESGCLLGPKRTPSWVLQGHRSGVRHLRGRRLLARPCWVDSGGDEHQKGRGGLSLSSAGHVGHCPDIGSAELGRFSQFHGEGRETSPHRLLGKHACLSQHQTVTWVKLRGARKATLTFTL